DDAFDNELEHVMAAAETPSEVVKASEFATLTSRRKLPSQMGQATTSSANGLQTPQTGGGIFKEPFNTQAITPGGALPSRNNDPDDESHQTATPSSSFDTPTPSRFRNVSADELMRDMFGILQEAHVRLAPDAETELKSLLSRHAKSAE
ncbi:hypothetical protein BKA66DRAFT_376289, partial [Pyrenochaeta sp. MPI-SDFR-AT-0127]